MALLVLSATINGIAAALFLIVVMLISGDAKIMGRYRNGRLAASIVAGRGCNGRRCRYKLKALHQRHP